MTARLATEALDAHTALVEWMTTVSGGRYMESITRQAYFAGDRGTGTAADPETAAATIIAALQVAGTFGVSADIAEALAVAAEDIPPFPFQPVDFPTPTGFVYLERTQMFTDSFGRPLVVRALTWGQVIEAGTRRRGVVFLLFTDPHDERDQMHDDWESIIVPEMREVGLLPAPLVPMFGGVASFGEVISEEHQAAWRVQGWLGTFLRFIDESFTTTEPEPADRPARRRASRALRRPGEVVQVVRLRRTAYESSGGGHRAVEHDHRWLVRGHWRRQWYPSQGRHLPRWIAPHIRGPDDMPLVVRPRAFRVDR